MEYKIVRHPKLAGSVPNDVEYTCRYCKKARLPKSGESADRGVE
jgi:hypothetical protein